MQAIAQGDRRGALTRRAGVVLGAALFALLMGSAGAEGDVSDPVDFSRDVIYQILTDRFVDGDPSNNPTGSRFSAGCINLRKYCGGDWAGIAQKISDGYLTQMGITALWITQPVENTFALDSSGTTAYHGFWARDYKRTNPAFGSFTDFANLIATAHAAGIKVVIDFTPNHSSSAVQNNPAFMEDGAVFDNGFFLASLNSDPTGVFHHNGETDFSSYEDGIYRSLFNLADYDHQNPAIDAYLKAAIAVWLDQGIDGIRVDAVKHSPPGWLKTWVDAIYAHRPVFVFGEWLLGAGEIDPKNVRFANDSGMSVLDFRFNDAIRRVLRDRTANWSVFDAMIQSTAGDYEQVIDLPTFIDSHDMDRFQLLGIDTRRTDMALAVALASRGIPIVYYGTEQYMTGSGDPGNRRMMAGFDRGTRAYRVIQRLSALRRRNPALGFGDTRARWLAGEVYAFERRFGDAVVLVAVNRGLGGSVSLSGLATALPPGSYPDALGGLLDGEAIRVQGDGSVEPFALAAGEVGVWEFAGPMPPRKFGPPVIRRTAAASQGAAAAAPRIGHVGPMTLRPGQIVTLEGQGFGRRAGVVRFGGVAGTLVAWYDQRIRVRVPELEGGLYAIAVQTADGSVSPDYPRFEVLSGAQVPVRFVVDNGQTFLGQNLYITGSVHELSNWSGSPEQALGPMFNQVVFRWPTWYYDASLPAGQVVEFKLLKIDGAGNVVWEGGAPHRFTTPAEGTAQVRVSWQDGGASATTAFRSTKDPR